MDSKTTTLGKILEKGTFLIPPFQRSYSWKTSHWQDLWQDIGDLVQENKEAEERHYMGYVVLQERKKQHPNEFWVVDGQQRLTTLSIVFLSTIGIVKDINCLRHADNLMKTYIENKDAANLWKLNKLTLNRYNDPVYANYLTKFEKAPSSEKRGSNLLLLKAYSFFKQKIVEAGWLEIEDLIRLATLLDKNIDLTYSTIPYGANTYKIFETLNATGMRLSVNDILKNHLFLVIDDKTKLSDEDITELDKRWERIERATGAGNLSNFLIVEWNRRSTLTRKKNLFSAIRKELRERRDVEEYLDVLENSSHRYAMIVNGEQEINLRKDYGLASREISSCLLCLRSQKIKSPHGLLLTALEKLQDQQKLLASVVKIIEIISVRYNGICQKQANKQEEIYHKLAYDIFWGNFQFNSEVKEQLRKIYPTDEEFKASFQKLDIEPGQHAKAKYILLSIEESIRKHRVDYPDLELEHILPRNPPADSPWHCFFTEEKAELCVNKLGNMTILPKELHKKLGVREFDFKKEHYASSRLPLCDHLITYDIWNPESIEKHQKHLADQALKIWKIDWEDSKWFDAR